MDNGMSAADIMALTKSGDNDSMANLWSNPFIYFVWMALFANGGIFGGNRGETAAAATDSTLTRNAIYEANNNQDILRSISAVDADVGAFERDAAGAWSNIRYDMGTGFNALNNSVTNSRFDTVNAINGINSNICNSRFDLLSGLNGVNANIADSRFASQDCCCTTNRNIDSVKSENYKNTCDITTAIHNEAEATRALINANAMQDLRDRLADKDKELLMSNFSLSQQIQNQAIIGALKPCPIPSYTVSSPYASVNTGCGCGFNV